jgi:hypothetical protein
MFRLFKLFNTLIEYSIEIIANNYFGVQYSFVFYHGKNNVNLCGLFLVS